MPSLIDLRRRIRAVKSTQQITKAMKMVAASKLRRAQERIQQARPFALQMRRVLHSLASRVDSSAHPLLDERAVPKADGRAPIIRSCARRSFDAATIFIALVICCVFLTDLMRRRMSKRLGIVANFMLRPRPAAKR